MNIPPELRIITIKQPWASLIVDGIKDVENRSWPFPATLALPFTIAVHAGARLDPKSTAVDLPTRAVVGLVDVVACSKDHESVWTVPGEWHWVLANPVKFDEPVPATGRMGLMPVSPELYAAICRTANL